MSDWTNITATYAKTYDNYVDEHNIIKIIEKEPILKKIGSIVAGESNSQFMTFEINRYYDNIDLSNKLIKFTYIKKTNGEIKVTGKTKFYSDNACNICYNDTKVRFSWLIPTKATELAGEIAVVISFIGLDDEEGYELKSTIFDLTILPSINSNSQLTAAQPTWFSDIESRLHTVEQATGSVELDYTSLSNKPSINGTTLNGNLVLDYLYGSASQIKLGGVKALEKTAIMTSPIGIDEDGFLWCAATSVSGEGSGSDGFSPLVSLTPAEDGSGTTLTIVDKNGIKTTFISNGSDGANGNDGTNGTNGTDGISITDVNITSDNKLIVELSNGSTITTENAIIVNSSSLISDTNATSKNATWSIDKIKSYVATAIGGIENGTY